jgi:hypothetical protein
MDLDLYLRVLWRFRRLVAIGFTLAVVLSVFSFAKISTSSGSTKLVYRQQQTWQSEAVLFVTQPGFPWGTTTPQYEDPRNGVPAIPKADAQRLSSWAVLYARLATTFQVQRLMQHPPKKPTDVTAETIAAPPFSTPAILPLISVKALGTTRERAAALATDQAQAIMKYVVRNQRGADISPSDRVMIQEVQPPVPRLATLVGKRGKTLPVIVFLAVMTAVIGLAFVLENLRPGIRAVSDADEDSNLPAQQPQLPAQQTRRSYKKRRRA